jgi:hypothetical protein
MKGMSDRKMAMGKGGPDEDGFFPPNAEHKILARPGEIKGFKYPDTEEQALEAQEQFVGATSRNMPKGQFRH